MDTDGGDGIDYNLEEMMTGFEGMLSREASPTKTAMMSRETSLKKTRHVKRLSEEDYTAAKAARQERAQKASAKKPTRQRKPKTRHINEDEERKSIAQRQTKPLNHHTLPTRADVAMHINYIMERVLHNIYHPKNRKLLVAEVTKDLIGIWKHCEVP